MKTITVDVVKKILPEISPKAVSRAFNGEPSLSLQEFLSCSLPASARVQVLYRAGVLGLELLARCASDAVEQAIHRHCLDCKEESSSDWARKWLSGSDRSGKSACSIRDIPQSAILKNIMCAAQFLSEYPSSSEADRYLWATVRDVAFAESWVTINNKKVQKEAEEAEYARQLAYLAENIREDQDETDRH
jgi:hypothetical protein